MHDTIVIGGGLFGSIVAATLRRAGQDVLVVDSGDPLAGSRAAGCVLNPAWMTNMSRSEKDAALLLLDEVYGLRRVVFHTSGGRKVDACRVEPRMVLIANGAWVGGKVRHVFEGDGRSVTVETKDRAQHDARHVVVATGRRAAALCPWAPAVQGRTGWSYRAPPVEKATIRQWAPYRQVVSFNMDDGRSWRGDGCAYVDRPSFWREMAASQARCLGTGLCVGHSLDFVRPDLYQRRMGIRPYAREKLAQPCVVETQGRVTCVTGGGKNGTAAAAWAAAQVMRIVGAA